jgi:hypothetical protein
VVGVFEGVLDFRQGCSRGTVIAPLEPLCIGAVVGVCGGCVGAALSSAVVAVYPDAALPSAAVHAWMLGIIGMHINTLDALTPGIQGKIMPVFCSVCSSIPKR